MRNVHVLYRLSSRGIWVLELDKEPFLSYHPRNAVNDHDVLLAMQKSPECPLDFHHIAVYLLSSL